ncbi:hypothetical protein [Pseudoduganella albidiflava]|uniref:Uncharacterized protein n=1 Tax=Pseudoduganella albidiflava TaxID=321983 RepID=A0A411WXC6_9BURK|nr:hypothetical protein [Pseudoduganella albidiflava]QBI01405.1 hypothetical protein EYF70_11495 [Pseudoduganella albidiflava]GGY35911.1 hypothetical protein GCM10007387_17720 [Pseudoduganella albidiflava]
MPFINFRLPMHAWHPSDESDLPLWVLDLDDELYSVDHRRLCVWPDEFDGRWHWEIQTWEDAGLADGGTCATLAEAQQAAVGAALRLAAKPAREQGA